MNETSGDREEHRDADGASNKRVQLARQGVWLVLLISGVVILAAMPLYRHVGPLPTSTGCRSLPSGFICQALLHSQGFFGIGLESSTTGIIGDSGPYTSTYWVLSIFIEMLLVVAYYWLRFYKMGISTRVWPVVTICLGVLILGEASRSWFSLIPSDMTIRGMQALFLIVLGLIVLALIDRRWSFALFVVGFLGLALLSCLYDVVNLFQRFDIGASWSAKN